MAGFEAEKWGLGSWFRAMLSVGCGGIRTPFRGLDAPKGARFGPASWPGADSHRSGDVRFRPAEKSWSWLFVKNPEGEILLPCVRGT